MEKQPVSIYIYPWHSPQGEVWQTSGYVFGDWVVHRCHPRERTIAADYPWHITHRPTGVRCFVSENVIHAIRAAKRLVEIEQPPIALEHHGENNAPTVTPISIEWITRCATALGGLSVFGISDSSVIPPESMVRYLQEKRNIVVFD